MLPSICLLPLVLGAPLLGSTSDDPTLCESETREDGVLAFVDVSVLPMDTRRVLGQQTVLVRGGRIAWVGNTAEAAVPEGAQRIEGNGRFLAPGLVDMHVHLMSADELPLYVINGVTTVRNMWGNPDHLRWRAEVEAGERIAPHIVTCGPILDGAPAQLRGSVEVANLDDAFAAIEAQHDAGYDFVKIYNRLTPEVYEGIVGIATELGLPVAGHVPRAVGLDLALEAGQASIEHLWGYPAALDAPPSGTLPNWAFDPDTERLEELCARTAAAGVWNTPTLVMWEGQELSASETRAFLEREEVALVPEELRRRGFGRAFAEADDLPDEERARRRRNRRSVVHALHQAGAGLLLGTDTGNPFVLPGFAVHDELELLIEAGLDSFEAIATGTANVGLFLGQEVGTIEVGSRADLILVDENPLQDPTTLRRPRGVAINGRWLDAGSLDRLRAELQSREEAQDSVDIQER